MSSSKFLDFNTRGNGKTFHYLRIMAYHGIPLVVHNLDYAKILKKQFQWHLKETAFIETPVIYSIQQRHLYLDLVDVKAIIDDPITLENDKYNWHRQLDFYSTEEIREIIREDFILGASWMYEK